MNDRSLSPPAFNLHVASPARVYDYYLGGKDNFPADRDAGSKVVDVFPGAPRLAQENRGSRCGSCPQASPKKSWSPWS